MRQLFFYSSLYPQPVMKTVLLKVTMYYTKVPYSVVSLMYREVCKQRLYMKKIVIPII